jgi:hypothetical protein
MGGTGQAVDWALARSVVDTGVAPCIWPAKAAGIAEGPGPGAQAGDATRP